MAEIKELIHHGILVTEIPHLGLTIEIQGKPILLNSKQEQMAIAWVRKLETPYVEDPVFCENFFNDFSEALGYKKLTDEDIDFSRVIDYIESERVKREALTKEEKKAQREARKADRDKLKKEYGTAILDGAEVEIANYTAEPSSIFMGRGEHPLRGKWKEGPEKKDIILNISSTEKINPKEWKEIVFEPECLWVAKWDDKLSGKTKYVWLSDNTPIKQDREIGKFDKAKLVGKNLEKIREGINKGIASDDEQTRKVALACYIIDRLIMRVGDEKDEDEADTVGATTLRPEHITIEGNKVTFNFLGKDSVEWNKEIEFPDEVIKALRELIEKAEKSNEDKAQIFDKIGSRHVNDFFGSIVDGLTAKVFRTFHATNTVSSYLDEADTNHDDPEFVKKETATMANLEAAIVCNHMKQVPKNFDNRLQRFRERKMKADERINKAVENQKIREEKLEETKKIFNERREAEREQKKILDDLKTHQEQLVSQMENADDEEKITIQKDLEKLKKTISTQKKKVATAKKRIDSQSMKVDRSKNTVGTAKERVYKAKQALKKIESQEKISKKTKVWNLGTSLKSYIDPRVYYEWGKEVDFEWRNYYSTTLQNKFSWVERDEEE